MPVTGDFSDRTIVQKSEQNSEKKVWVVVGASRGLGLALAETIIARGECDELILLSRKIEKMSEHFETHANIAFEKMNFKNSEDLVRVAQNESVRDDAQSVLPNKNETECFVVSDKSIKRNFPMVVRCVSFDASDEAQWPLALQFQSQKLFYVAGGGPYGAFENKKWSDHQWAFKVNFLCPAFLLHQLMQTNICQQIVIVGSAIAESKPDVNAASYAAAKHALKGLITSVQAEQKKMSQAQIDLRLFSPGYIDTPMLPTNAWPRQLTVEQQALMIASPKALAEQLLGWISHPNDANCHLNLSKTR